MRRQAAPLKAPETSPGESTEIWAWETSWAAFTLSTAEDTHCKEMPARLGDASGNPELALRTSEGSPSEMASSANEQGRNVPRIELPRGRGNPLRCSGKCSPFLPWAHALPQMYLCRN